VAAENRDPELVFLFACDLASMIDSIPDSPSYAKNPKYIFENSLFIILNSLSYFGKEVSKLPDNLKRASMKSAARAMTDKRYRGITNCLNMIARKANTGGNRKMAQQVEIALKMVEEIKGSLPNSVRPGVCGVVLNC
jgi:hypothetical protein